MGFSTRQIAALRRRVDGRFVRTRDFHGRELSYLEGWYTISAANRIFGFDGWSRETVEVKCVLARESRGAFVAVYTAKVRITVATDSTRVVREGHGTGEGRGETPGEAHDTALKAAETDATKRALITFGKPFGLELYRSDNPGGAGKAAARRLSSPPDYVPPEKAPSIAHSEPTVLPDAKPHPDDGTPIPRPSTYFGRERFHEVREPIGELVRQAAEQATDAEKTASSVRTAHRIDKSVLALSEPKRLRDRGHLKYVAAQACLVCGRKPSDPHHLRFAQPRALGMKVSDEFTVPLCRGHHRSVHQFSNEPDWWESVRIEPLPIARKLWEATHPTLCHSGSG